MAKFFSNKNCLPKNIIFIILISMLIFFIFNLLQNKTFNPFLEGFKHDSDLNDFMKNIDIKDIDMKNFDVKNIVPQLKEITSILKSSMNDINKIQIAKRE